MGAVAWPAEFSRDDDRGWACVGPDAGERNVGDSWKRWTVAHRSGLPYAAALDPGDVAVLDGADHILLASPSLLRISYHYRYRHATMAV